MVAGIFHQGSGLGNQLFRYVTTRVLAEDKGYEFGMVAPELFKGKEFMNLDMGTYFHPYSIESGTGKVMPQEGVNWRGKPMLSWQEKTPYYDPEINFVEDNTIIDGNLEDPRYFEHRFKEIHEWLGVAKRSVGTNECYIGFRGGEYQTVPELFLPQEYWDRAIAMMKKINPDMVFTVVTDDILTAKRFFPPEVHYEQELMGEHDIGDDWRAMRYAPYAIIANSSFYIMPRLLNGGLTIAPRYWNRYNLKRWDYPQNYYGQFRYIHHEM